MIEVVSYRMNGKFCRVKLSRIVQFREFRDKKFRVLNAYSVN